MPKKNEEVFFVLERIKTLTSLLRVFDLIHYHYSIRSLPQNFKSVEEVRESQSTLYIIVLSYLYSLFDRTGLDITNLEKLSLSLSTRNKLNEILELWKPLKAPITKIRHNLGFHGGKLPQFTHAYKGVINIDDNNLVPAIVLLFDKLESFSKILEHEL